MQCIRGSKTFRVKHDKLLIKIKDNAQKALAQTKEIIQNLDFAVVCLELAEISRHINNISYSFVLKLNVDSNIISQIENYYNSCNPNELLLSEVKSIDTQLDLLNSLFGFLISINREKYHILSEEIEKLTEKISKMQSQFKKVMNYLVSSPKYKKQFEQFQIEENARHGNNYSYNNYYVYPAYS